MSCSYLFYGSIVEKCGNFGKNGRFSGRIWPDWGNTARADMAGLGSIGLKQDIKSLLQAKYRQTLIYLVFQVQSPYYRFPFWVAVH